MAALPGELDDLDVAIIHALQADGRIAWRQVAASLGADRSTVARRGQRLLESGVVRVVGLPDVIACGFGFPVLMRLRCTLGSVSRVAETLATRDDVRFVSITSGSADCVAEFIVRSSASLVALVDDDLSLIPGITSADTQVPIKAFSWDWIPEPQTAQRFAIGTNGIDDAPSPSRLPDDLDLALLDPLACDGRAPVSELARTAGVSVSTALRRIAALVDSGRLRIRTLVEPSTLGYGVEFMLWMSVTPGLLDEVASQLTGVTSVRYLAATTGPHNLVGQVVLRTHGDLFDFTTGVLGRVEGLITADITLQVRTVKRATLSIRATGL